LLFSGGEQVEHVLNLDAHAPDAKPALPHGSRLVPAEIRHRREHETGQALEFIGQPRREIID
jgi:hypothetical protein